MPELLRLALEQLTALPPALWLRRSGTLYLLVNAAHIGAIGLLIGSIVPLDLRLLGVLKPTSLALLAPVLARTAAVGLALAILTGAILFTVRAQEYLQNPAFVVKMGLLGAGAINAWLVRRGGRRTCHAQSASRRNWISTRSGPRIHSRHDRLTVLSF